MNREHSDALIACKAELCKGLFLAEVLVFLRSNGVLRQVVIEDIESKTTEFARNSHFIDTLVKCGSNAFAQFIGALHETGQHHLADKLQEKARELLYTTEGPSTSRHGAFASNPTLNVLRSANRSRSSSRITDEESGLLDDVFMVDETKFYSADGDIAETTFTETTGNAAASPNGRLRSSSVPRELRTVSHSKRKSTIASQTSHHFEIEEPQQQEQAVQPEPQQQEQRSTELTMLEKYQRAFSCFNIFNLGFGFFLLLCLIFYVSIPIKMYLHMFGADYSGLYEDEIDNSNISISAKEAHKHDTLITKFLATAAVQVPIIICCFVSWVTWVTWVDWTRLRTALVVIFTIGLFADFFILFFGTFTYLSRIDAIGQKVTDEFLNGINMIPPVLVVHAFKCCPSIDKTGSIDGYRTVVDFCEHGEKCEDRIQSTIFKSHDLIIIAKCIFLGVFLSGFVWFMHKWRASVKNDRTQSETNLVPIIVDV